MRETAQFPLAGMVAPESKTLLEPAVAVAVPPQVLARAFGVATTRPAGSESVKPTPVKETEFEEGLASVRASEVVPLGAMLEAPKDFAMEGGATTARLAVLLVEPVPPLADVMAPVVLSWEPAVAPVTFIEKLQEEFAAIDAPLRLIELAPAVAVMVPAPQEPVRPLGVETVRPAGKLSLNATPVRAVAALALETVKDSVVEPLSGILGAPKVLVMVGGTTTVMEALEVLPVPPWVDVMETLLFFMPAEEPVTLRLTVQEASEVSVPAERLAAADPATAVAVPEQVLARPLGVATTNPAGRESVKARPVRVEELGLEMVKERDVEPLSGTVEAPKALAMEGGATTLRLALAVFPVPP